MPSLDNKFTNKPTLVMGARGSVGALVLDALLKRGVPVRASARSPKADQFPTGVEVFAADLTDEASLTAAFDGVAHVFLYANLEGVEGVIAAARTAGIERVVLMSSGSVLHPSATGNAITEEHRRIEEAFAAATDLAVIPIRPLVLATNDLRWARSIKAGGPLELYRPDAATAPVHERDIAAVAVAAITGVPTPAMSEMLTGPTRLSQREQVAAIASSVGKDVAIAELTRAEAADQLRQFMPPVEAEAVLQFIDDSEAGNSPATDTVATVLGRAATSFEDWVADHATDF